ncbi:MAG: MFS transporter [Sphingobacteriales bacterium]|nr:MAG: MFS transporter [Sphingobacteriales bacterium]
MKRIINLYKSAYLGLSPSTWWLSLVMLINRSGTMVVPFMTLYLTQSLNYKMSQAGFIMALWGVGSVCGGFVGGRLTDKLGSYFIQMTTLIGGGLLFLVLGQMRDYAPICVTTFILSFINESFRPANSAAIAHYSRPENRTRSYSLNRLSINLGWAAGGALGGFIAAKNYHLLFWIDGFTNIGAAIVLWLLLAPSKNEATAKKPLYREKEVASSVYNDKPYLAFIVLTTLFAYCFFQIFSTLPLYYKKELGLSESYIGIVMAINGLLIAFFEMVIVHNIEGKRHNLQYITIGVALVALSYLAFNLIPGKESLAIIAMLIVTAGEIMSMPFMNSYWVGRTSSNNRGQYAGLYTVAWSAAQVLGPATGTIIAEDYGFAALWWMIGGLCLVAALGYKMLQLRTQAR